MTVPTMPTLVSFLPMAATGIGSSTAADQLGNPVADLFVWWMQQNGINPPEGIVKDIHTLWVFLFVILAYIIHWQFVKTKPQT